MPPSALNPKPQHPVRWGLRALRLAVALATAWLVVLVSLGAGHRDCGRR